MQKSIQWRSCYEVGDKRIDTEHRIFLGLIAQLADDIGRGRERERIERTFAEIVKYGEFHFLSEENLMIESGYPEYSRHKAIHDRLLADLRGIQAERRDGDALIEFVVDWFTKHTVSEDTRIANHLALWRASA